MKCKLYNPNSDREAAWISWGKISDYWERNTFHPLTTDMLKPALHNLWFQNLDEEFPLFNIGAIHSNQNSIIFHNGRHRTILLTQFRDNIPLAICDTIKEHPEIKGAIIRKIEEGDFIEFPDLPIISCAEFRA